MFGKSVRTQDKSNFGGWIYIQLEHRIFDIFKGLCKLQRCI